MEPALSQPGQPGEHEPSNQEAARSIDGSRRPDVAIERGAHAGTVAGGVGEERNNCFLGVAGMVTEAASQSQQLGWILR